MKKNMVSTMNFYLDGCLDLMLGLDMYLRVGFYLYSNMEFNMYLVALKDM